MTLDHGCKPTIKGHFCSLLISNIFCLSSLSIVYPSLRFTSLKPTNNNYHFFNKNTVLCFCLCGFKRRISDLSLPFLDPTWIFFLLTHSAGLEGSRLTSSLDCTSFVHL